MQSKRGILGKVGTCATGVCCCHIGGDVVTGQSDGSLYLWKVRAYVHEVYTYIYIQSAQTHC
jgi:hypothetical protein